MCIAHSSNVMQATIKITATATMVAMIANAKTSILFF